MKFNDMLKKKKQEPAAAPEDLNELMDEIQDVNEARQNMELDNENEEQEAQPQAAAEAELSAEEKLKDQLVQANDKYLRLYAEFDNFRRRTAKERQELLLSGGKDVLAALLPVADDFERALKAMETATDIIPVKEGVALIQNKLKHILTGKGVKEMETKGQTFDADIHEAITNIPAGDEMKGKVVDELEKGYYLNDKVLRFAKVVVGG
ncbi:nucleotide exchange factor GrpE [Mucilaginibacter rivuli]|uniref:nucleotide exchange factor GrpE n=1 Tax=Mucilaginibacter rivuli TaxID=2857527 RepID=UPI002103D88F|nr:nucleotide exchange factor GrpE [Mucilaginibacter rivuli]